MKNLILLLAIVAISIITLSGCKKDTESSTESAKYKSFNNAMRVLWSDHASWTRNVIINLVDGAPGTTEAVARLLQNQVDIGNAIKPYYGEAGGNALASLLHNHITVAADLIVAAKNGNTSDYDAASATWYANADSVAVFLNTANPDHFDLAEWKTMMNDHLDSTVEEVVARIEANYAADVAAYDKVYAELMMMADMLSEGIAKQFPDKF
jgi:uncharacterized protein YceK